MKVFKLLKKILKGIVVVSFVTAVIVFFINLFSKKIGNHQPYGLYERYIKRPLDAFLSMFALLMLSPILFVVGVMVKIKLGFPVFFVQERPGRDGKVFKLFKFRTMTDEKDENGELLPDDQRIPKFGQFLRSTSLDELPELINILKGDMSVVGPRPLLVRYLDRYNEVQARRHEVRPGLTGWAQINGLRGDTSIEKRIEHDLYYIENWTIGLDFKILFLTIFKGFINKNAY